MQAMTSHDAAANTKTRWVRAIAGVAIVAILVAGLALWHPSNLYPWLKAVHVMAVIAWMAGMLYLPRLFVYHCEAETGSRQSETFKLMERRLLKAIINPAMIVTWLLGLWLVWYSQQYRQHWFEAKFVLVFLLLGVHGVY